MPDLHGITFGSDAQLHVTGSDIQSPILLGVTIVTSMIGSSLRRWERRGVFVAEPTAEGGDTRTSLSTQVRHRLDGNLSFTWSLLQRARESIARSAYADARDQIRKAETELNRLRSELEKASNPRPTRTMVRSIIIAKAHPARETGKAETTSPRQPCQMTVSLFDIWHQHLQSARSSIEQEEYANAGGQVKAAKAELSKLWGELWVLDNPHHGNKGAYRKLVI